MIFIYHIHNCRNRYRKDSMLTPDSTTALMKDRNNDICNFQIIQTNRS